MAQTGRLPRAEIVSISRCEETFVNCCRRYGRILLVAALSTLGFLVFVATFDTGAAFAAEDEKRIRYLGHLENKRCHNCHEEQWVSWKKTKHADAMESLEPGTDVGAKEKHDLDPAKDYTEDPKCVKCHVTGWESGRLRHRQNAQNEKAGRRGMRDVPRTRG